MGRLNHHTRSQLAAILRRRFPAMRWDDGGGPGSLGVWGKSSVNVYIDNDRSYTVTPGQGCNAEIRAKKPVRIRGDQFTGRGWLQRLADHVGAAIIEMRGR